MLALMARTRPARSPSQPNNRPPAAAPRRKAAMKNDNHWSAATSIGVVFGPANDWMAGRVAGIIRDISMPAPIQPRKTAISTQRRCAEDSSVLFFMLMLLLYNAVVHGHGKAG